MSVVSINIIRKLNAQFQDDTISIRRSGENILVRYKDRQCGDLRQHELVLPATGLSRYIQNLGYLFMRDSDPFDSMQLNFPGFPTFLATRESINNTDTQDALMDIAEIVSESWFQHTKSYSCHHFY